MVDPLISYSLTTKYIMMTVNIKKGSPHIDKIFKYIAIGSGTFVIAIIVMIVVNLGVGSAPVWEKEGLYFLTGSDWNSVEDREIYGAAPYIMGTLVTAGIAIVISVPLSFGIGMFLSELSPKLLRTPLAMVIELLAAVPSVIYGLWGLLVFRTYVQDWIEVPLHNLFGDQSIIFAGTPFGLDILTASIVLAIMIVPTISSISREIMIAVPNSQREAAYMLGATKWEAFQACSFTIFKIWINRCSNTGSWKSGRGNHGSYNVDRKCNRSSGFPYITISTRTNNGKYYGK